tara:strand:- start:130 stop:1209 length:1080 start_codon:yes stop_codon:yes gene_type:complete
MRAKAQKETKMSANLFGNRLELRREPAWHGLGHVFPQDEKITALDAMANAGVLFGVDKFPQVIKLPDGTEIETGAYAVVREPTHDDPEHRVLATVGKNWTAIQAADLGKLLNPISERFPVETVGAIGIGEKIFITLNAGSIKIAGEDHDLYWLVTDHRDGTGALSIAFTPVRVVCQNTLIYGLHNAKVSVTLRHNKAINVDTSFYLDLFNQMATAQDTVVEAMDSLTTVTLVESQIKQIVDAAYINASKPNRLKISEGFTEKDVSPEVWKNILADRKEPWEKFQQAQARVNNIKDHAYLRIEAFNDEYPKRARTPWAVYNAIVETEDYRRGHEDSGTKLFGTRADAKARAFDKALSYVR